MGTRRPLEPTSWGAHSRVETSLDYWRRKCSHRPGRGGWGLPSAEPLSPLHSFSLSTPPSPDAASPPHFLPFPAEGAGLPSAPWPPRPSQALRVPGTQVLQLVWSHRALALTSYFSGAPEMRKSLLNRTGGLSPAEKLGLSVTFFLQGRTGQPQQDSQASLSTPFLHPIYLRSLAQGTLGLFPPISLRRGRWPLQNDQPPPVPHGPSLHLVPGPCHFLGPRPSFLGFFSWALAPSAPLAARMWSRKMNSFSGKLVCVCHKEEK